MQEADEQSEGKKAQEESWSAARGETERGGESAPLVYSLHVSVCYSV